jgi:hypothetical protein
MARKKAGDGEDLIGKAKKAIVQILEGDKATVAEKLRAAESLAKILMIEKKIGGDDGGVSNFFD